MEVEEAEDVAVVVAAEADIRMGMGEVVEVRLFN